LRRKFILLLEMLEIEEEKEEVKELPDPDCPF